MSALPRSIERRPSARRSRPRLGSGTSALLVVVAVGLLASRAWGEEPSSAPDALAPPALEGPASAGQAVARIVLVGALADDPELLLLLDELLRRQGVATEITRAERLEPGALFEQGGGETLVQIAAADPRQVRLLLRGPHGERYLLRKLALPNGLDAVGRELIGQVVESSVVALVRTSEGLSREEAARELVGESTVPAPSLVRAPSRPSEPTSVRVPARSTWEPRLTLRYTGRWSGEELGLAHGPGVSAGVRRRSSVLLGAELGVERYFAQTLRAPALSAEVQLSSAQALFELGWPPLPHQALLLAFGPALELSRVRPTSGAAGITLAARQLDVVPAWRAELRYELGGQHWAVGVAASLELSLVRVHYELAGSGAREELATPSVLRPGAVLSLTLR